MAQASDDFNITNENPLSHGGLWDKPGVASAMQVVSNAVEVVSGGPTENMARRATPTMRGDQWSQLRLASFTSGEFDLFVRIQGSTDASGYGIFLGGSNEIDRVTDNGTTLSFALIGTTFTNQGGAANDVFRFEVHGTDFTGFKNGASFATRSESPATYTTGQPGLGGSTALATNFDLDDWSGGDVFVLELVMAPYLPT